MKFFLLFAMAMLVASLAHAHEGKKHDKKAPAKMEQKAWGIVGIGKPATRTIAISMTDTMRFAPDAVNVKLGETIRFTVKNDGKMLHEMVIGTKKELDAHAALMLKFPGMEHDEPYMVHVDPGKSGEIIWTFNRTGSFDFACLIAGHYQAGMKGTILVAAK
jgi:uncharacterized cupredoxin-like copper-binding protein